MSLTGKDLLGGPPPTLLPDEPGPRDLLDAAAEPVDVAAAHPTSSLAWALLAEQALTRSAHVEAYAYARTGYHRGLDALRRSGWKGYGPVPWAHEPNQGLPARPARARGGRRRDRRGRRGEPRTAVPGRQRPGGRQGAGQPLTQRRPN
jgi:hypothetical protein